jgi:hypothetical protein
MDIAELDAMLAAAKQPEKTVPICLRGDLQADWEELDRELTELRTKNAGTLAGDPAEGAVADRIRALEAEMATSTLTLRLRALRRKQWMALLELHPARPDNAMDKIYNLNVDVFFPDLIARCLVSPEMDQNQLDTLIDSITSRQYDVLTEVAWNLNRADVSVPFSYTASRITGDSGETSKRQSGSASATDDSQAGSRRKSRSTSTKTTS